jgi:hypothetical protein
MTMLQQNTAPTAPRFLRSVRLDQDLSAANTLKGYVVTPQVRSVLRRIITALKVEGTARAWTLTGPYGTGKSAFALYLSRLLQEFDGEAWHLLVQTDGVLALELGQVLPRPLLPMALTLRRAPLGVVLLEGVLSLATRLPGAAALVDSVTASLADAQSSSDSRTVMRHVASLKTKAVEAGYGGLLIVLDELGKGLEYEARHGGGDIYLLQELAEVAARSTAAPLLLVGVLHQGFEQYSEHLLASARKEWGKIQGRFEDVAFLEPPEQQMRLAAQALALLSPLPSQALRMQAQGAAQALIELGQAPKAIASHELAAQAAPLHPAALAVLPSLFRRFAQNERSLFAFLLSGEPHAVLQQWQARQQLIRLADLFDYFSVNLLSSLARQAFARRWIEVVDALEREPELAPLDIEILKTVGLLGILGDVGPLSATYEMICVALHDVEEHSAVRAGLDRLQEKSLVVYRRYNQSYRVWEGSDIDVEGRLEEGRRIVSVNLSLSETLARYLPRRPLVARRHSFETGTLRYFEVQYADSPPTLNTLKVQSGGQGILLCALPTNVEGVDAFVRWAESPEVTAREDLLIAVPRGLHTLREAATEVRTLYWLKDTVLELRDDRVARREVSERLAHLEALLMGGVEQLLDPRPAPLGSETIYLYEGELCDIRKPRGMVQLLSDILDNIYSQSPRVQNELVNRRTLSSAAAAARGKLMTLMLSSAGQSLLGLEAEMFPPERSMYESVLRETQLHVPAHSDHEAEGWQFADPPADHPTNLYPTWQAIAALIFEAAKPLKVADLFAALSAPPYGVTEGLQPVLLLAFLQVHLNEVSFYREGTFVPDPGMADFEVLTRRPELFAVMGSRVTGGRADVLTRLAKGYRTEAKVVPVARALIHGVRSLPDTSWRTRSLPESVLRLRETFTQARSPEQLLFLDIPAALDLPPISDEPTSPVAIETFFGALNEANTLWAAHAPKQLRQARSKLLFMLGFPENDDGWRQLIMQARLLEQRPLPTTLQPLIKRLSAEGEESTVLDGVLALIAGRSPRSWTDADAERFPSQAHAIAQTYAIAARQLGYASPDVEQGSEDYAERVRSALSLRLGNLSDRDKDAVRLALLKLLQELDN